MAEPLRPRKAFPSVLPIQASTLCTASGCGDDELAAATIPLVTLTRPCGPAGIIATPQGKVAFAWI
ncbi:Uncharacterised protein [Mycobacteroides abscessus subsp. abscessus]|nr:Uncharacterised protein [Mycobacteroides abscessus subsp. abscessus]